MYSESDLAMTGLNTSLTATGWLKIMLPAVGIIGVHDTTRCANILTSAQKLTAGQYSQFRVELVSPFPLFSIITQSNPSN